MTYSKYKLDDVITVQIDYTTTVTAKITDVREGINSSHHYYQIYHVAEMNDLYKTNYVFKNYVSEDLILGLTDLTEDIFYLWVDYGLI